MVIKNTIRLIKSTFNRFVAIFAIVLIGVSFMMGLRSNYDIMKLSVEEYYDNHNFYDVQVYSNYGFDDKDVKAINDLNFTRDVFASKTRDVYLKDKNDNELVTRVLEIDSDLNTIELKQGKMPSKIDECLIISGYKNTVGIGDKISLYLKDEDIDKSLSVKDFTVVGEVKAPEYMSETFTTSLLDNKELNNVIYVMNNVFVSDYYSSLYIRLRNAEELVSFSDEYIDYVNEKMNVLESFSINQSKELRNRIVNEATERLNNAKAELEENKNKYQKELDDAKKKLNDGKIELDNSKKLIEDGEKLIVENENKLNQAQTTINENKKKIQEEEEKLNSAVEQINNTGMSVDEFPEYIENLNNTYVTSTDSLKQLTTTKEQLQGQIDANKIITNASEYTNSADILAVLETMEVSEEDPTYLKLKQEYDAFVFIETSEPKLAEIDSQIAALNTAIDKVNASMQELVGRDFEEGYAYITTLINQFKQNKQLLDESKEALNKAQNDVNYGYQELQSKKKELEQGKIDYKNGIVKYENGQKEYKESKAKFELEIANAEDRIADGEEKLAELTKAPKWIVLSRNDSNYATTMYSNTCEQMKSIGTIIPLLFFVVAALVCSTTMTRLIDEQRGQIGIYRALGFTKREVSRIYLLYVVIASLIASAIAIFIGVFTFPTIIYKTWRLMYDLPDIIYSFPITNVILCVSCFTLLMMLVTWIVTRNTLKECSAQLLRPKSPKATKQTLIEKWTWLWSKLRFTTKVTARNILRYKGRFIMTVIGVAGCTSLLLMGYGIKDSISSVVSLQFTEINKHNYVVSLTNDRHIDQILNDIKSDNDNEVYVPVCEYSGSMSINDKDLAISVTIANKNSIDSVYGIYDDLTGSQIEVDNNGAYITAKFAANNNISVGDTVSLESQNKEKKEIKVNGIVRNYLGNVIYMSSEYYSSQFNENPKYTQIDVVNNGNIDNLLSLQNKYNDVSTVNDYSAATATFDTMIQALDLIIIVIIVVAGALAFVVLINLTNVNISERIREIATLKVLGFRPNEVNSYIFKEVFLMSIVGAIIGLPLGRLEEGYVMSIIDMEMCAFPHIIEPVSYVYAFVITIIFTIIVLFLTRRTLKNVNMIESLKSVE